MEPYRLAVKAEAFIPRDSRLAALFSKCSVTTSVKTEPAGAKVYFKEYRAPENEWQYLGVTPIEQIRLPIGIFRWKLEKEGYEPVLAASSSWDIGPTLIVPFPIARRLDRKGSIPPG